MSHLKNNVIAEHLGFPSLLPAHRCVGNSTAIALTAISNALRSPGQEINIRDHVGGPKACENTARLIERYLERLGFVGFKILRKSYGLVLVFNLYKED